MKVGPLCLSGEERMREHNESRSTYVFELSEEARRLEQQSRFLAPLTRRLLEDAGITAGMKVLDVGCGAVGMCRCCWQSWLAHMGPLWE